MRHSGCSLLTCLAIAAVCGSARPAPAAEPDPLERLRQKSAAARWEELRAKLDQGELPQQPLAEQLAPAAGPVPAKQTPSAAAPQPQRDEVRPLLSGPWDSKPASHVQAPADPAEDAWVPLPTTPSDRPVPVHRISIPKVPAATSDSARQRPAARFALQDEFDLDSRGLPGIGEDNDLPLPEPEDPFQSGEKELEELNVPKRISQILPFDDYNPTGEDNCRYQCPPGEDCPQGDGTIGLCPEDVPLPEGSSAARFFEFTGFHWSASNIFYQPLYFEDAQLERYGHTYNDVFVQPFVSVGKFGLQFAALPYQMAIDPVHSCVSPLGFYRPGECAPQQIPAIPWNTRAAAHAAAAYTGLIYLVP